MFGAIVLLASLFPIVFLSHQRNEEEQLRTTVASLRRNQTQIPFTGTIDESPNIKLQLCEITVQPPLKCFVLPVFLGHPFGLTPQARPEI